MGCLNIHAAHVTSNNFTNNRVGLFFVSDLEIVSNINDALDKRGNILRHNKFKTLKIEATH